MIASQARNKHKMTWGAERVAHINPPPPAPPLRSLGESTLLGTCQIPTFVYKYFLFLSLIFRLCWLWRNRELVWDIVRGKFAKQLLSVFFLPNEVISYVYKGQSICSVLVNMQHHEVVQSIEYPAVERKYVFTRFKAEKDLSPTALVASMTFPGCSLIRIVYSTTPGSVSLVHGFTHDKRVPCLFSTCLDFLFGGSCEDIVRLSM